MASLPKSSDFRKAISSVLFMRLFLLCWACPEMLSAINEADTAFAVINMCDDLTPQAKSALREAWAKVQAILVKLSPDGALAEAVKETPTSAYNLMNPSKEAQDQFPLEDWQYEVMNGDTKRGYNEWLAVQLEDCQHTL